MDIVQLKQMEPIFGSWYVEREIGSGSFGKVYAIYKDDGGFRFRAALKVITIPTNNNDIQELDSQGFDHAAKVRYFDNISAGIMEEIRIMNTLRGYTNIVCFEDYQTIPHADGIGRDILIRMELLESLDKHMQRIRATQYDVVVMLRDIAQALVLCDKKNIIHRDIKPDNIMVSENGDYKLVDFGIARNMERTSQASTKAGSYPYMAPEVQMHQPYGKAVDIYSLGVVAYRELNAYRYPFLPPYPQPFTAEERDMALYRRFKGDKIPPIPGVSRQLFAIIEKCIAHKPEHRYANPQLLLNDLNAVISQPELKKKRLFDDSGNLLPPHSEKGFDPTSGSGGSGGGTGSGGGSSISFKGGDGGSGAGSTLGPGPGTISEPKKKKKTGLIIAIVLLLAAAGAAAFFFLQPKEDPQKPHEAISASILREAEIPEHTDPQTVAAQGSEKIRVEGNASPNAELVLNYSTGTQTAQADGEGHYSFELDSEALPIDAETEISVSYAQPNETDRAASVSIRRDGTCSLLINESESSADQITGTTDPWAKVYGADAGGTPAQADGNGAFTAANTAGDSGSVLSLYAEDPYGNRSETREYTVPYRPVALSIDCTGKNGSQVITGKVNTIQLSGEGPDMEIIQVRAVSDKGVSLYDGMVMVSNGGWVVEDVDLGTLIGDGTLTLSAEWAGNALQPGQTATNDVKYDRNCYLSFTATVGNVLTEDNHSLQGTTDPGATVKLFSADGTLLASVTADGNGVFVMNGLNLIAADTPYGIATDVSGNDSQPYRLQQVQAGQASTVTGADTGETRTPITLHIEGADAESVWKDNKVTLTGEAQPGVDLEALIGTRTMATFQAQGEGETGTYTAEIPLTDFYSNVEEQLMIRVRYADGIGTTSEAIILQYDTGISDPVLTELVNDTVKTIHGTADPGDRVFLGEGTDKGISGIVAETTAEADGTFTIQMENPLEVGGNYLLYAQDRANHTSRFIPVKVAVTVREKISIHAMQNGKILQSGNRINRKVMLIELQSGDSEAGTTAELRGTESGTEVLKEIEKGQTLVSEDDFEGFADGEVITLTVYYTDWGRTRNPFTMDLVFDISGEKPVLKARGLTSEMTSVEGTAEPGSAVHLVTPAYEKVAEADENGVFRFDGVTFNVGETCTLYAVDDLGNMSDSTTYEVAAIAMIAIQTGGENLEKGYVNGSEGRLDFTGTAEPEKTIEITLNGAAAAQQISVSEEGEWSASVDFTGLQPDSENVLAFFYAGNATAMTEFSFIYDPACAEITVSGPVTEDTETIRGTAEAGATVILNVDDSEKGRAECDQNGEFRLELPAEYRQQGTNLTLRATDRAGNEANPYSITVTASQRLPIQIDRDNLTEYEGVYLIRGGVRTLQLSGTGYANLGITVTVTTTDEPVRQTTEEIQCEDGRWTTKIVLPEPWTGLQITASYSDGKTEDFSDTLQLKYDGVCKLEYDTKTLLEIMTTLDFRAEEGAEIIATLNGEQALTIEDLGEGNHRIALPELHEGDVLRIMATDRAGNTATKEFTVQLEERKTVTINLDTVPVNGQTTALNFHGTATPDRPVKVTIGDREFGDIPVDGNGNWTLFVPMSELALKEGKNTYKAGYMDRGTESEGSFIYDSETALTVEDEGRNVHEDTTEIHGETEPESTVVLLVNGTVTQRTDAAGDGSFAFMGTGPFNAGDEIRITAADPAGNQAETGFTVQAVNRQKITMEEPVLQNGLVKAGSLHISGQAAEGKPVRVVLLKDGQQTAELTSTPNKGGTWNIPDAGVRLEDGGNYTITAEYADGKSGDSTASIQFTADGVCVLSGIPERILDLDTDISGQTEGSATVYLLINGEEKGTVHADQQGNFRLTGLETECDDRIEIYAEDLLGNRSEKATRTVDTGKERIWFSIDQPKTGSTAKDWVLTSGTVFSHEAIQVYYTLTSSDGAERQIFTLTADDLGENDDREAARAAADKAEAGLTDRCSVRYMYELYHILKISEVSLPNGTYRYELYAKQASSDETFKLHEAEITLADPDKEEKIEVKDYMNEYPNSTPKFAAGLDELVMDSFPRNEILMTGWIWAPEGSFGEAEVVYYRLEDKFQNAYTAEDIREFGGLDELVYRNIATEKKELAQKYGTPDLEKAGFVLRVPVTEDMNLKPGTHTIEVRLRDRMAASEEWKIGTYTITISDSGNWNAESKAEQIIAGWDDRPAEE